MQHKELGTPGADLIGPYRVSIKWKDAIGENDKERSINLWKDGPDWLARRQVASGNRATRTKDARDLDLFSVSIQTTTR